LKKENTTACEWVRFQATKPASMTWTAKCMRLNRSVLRYGATECQNYSWITQSSTTDHSWADSNTDCCRRHLSKQSRLPWLRSTNCRSCGRWVSRSSYRNLRWNTRRRPWRCPTAWTETTDNTQQYTQL